MPINEVNTIKKFMELLQSNIKLPMLSNFKESIFLLQFLNDLGLDPTSTGYLAEEMHMSKS